MEYNIKKNDYVESSEVRHEVVQMLIDYYITHFNTCWNEFCPNNCWRKTYAIGRRNGHLEIVGRATQATEEISNSFLIRTCEMKKFFEVWLDAGYYISKGYYSVRGQTATLYKFTNKPYTDNGFKLVNEFTENID